jgi:D-sedoheptulose 7-phosphate isomerase
MNGFIKNSLTEASNTLDSFINNKNNLELISNSINALSECYSKNGRAFSCGNGGSMCDAIHFAEELTGRFRKNRPPLPAMAISDPGHITCVANDFGYDQIYSRHLEAWGNKGDVLVAISTSGNSPNIINAVNMAHQKEMKVIGLLGKGGGKLESLVDFPLVINSNVSDRIQEMHIKLIHIFIEGIERKLFPDHYVDSEPSKSQLNAQA